ncbi:ScyD/ScyE family protein [Marmoricola sp. URHB0036]|uniref:ScyD/ScyE family protein n=1 Tax=Marmoricola sp. URHB0036 TaxID=1298863 RepID=UPI0004227D56|nr:ScyD/ScyE family protein [Marmoricola sp. URHB0036]
MSLRNRTLITTTVAAVSAALALAASAAAPASAKPTSEARTLDSSVLAPFQIAVRGGTVWWTDGFKGTVTRLKSGKKSIIVSGGAEGVAVSGKKLAYSVTTDKTSRVVVRRPGRKPQVIKVRRFEAVHNPDGNVHYGIIKNYNQCAADFLTSEPGSPPARYTGVVDSHPYQLASLPGGAWAVAEAAGNDILRISRTGRISVVALLPRQPITFTQAQADALGAPDCLVGVRYAFEPVPTDVERDSHGNLWVSVLPGGPEGPALGARGAVYKITRHGKVIRIHGGFNGATNLAVWNNQVYVAELFGGRISTIRNGKLVTVRSLAQPVSVEATKYKLFVGQLAPTDDQGNPTGPGHVLRFPR